MLLEENGIRKVSSLVFSVIPSISALSVITPITEFWGCLEFFPLLVQPGGLKVTFTAMQLGGGLEVTFTAMQCGWGWEGLEMTFTAVQPGEGV